MSTLSNQAIVCRSASKLTDRSPPPLSVLSICSRPRWTGRPRRPQDAQGERTARCSFRSRGRHWRHVQVSCEFNVIVRLPCALTLLPSGLPRYRAYENAELVSSKSVLPAVKFGLALC
jgi:hypothetical protein